MQSQQTIEHQRNLK